MPRRRNRALRLSWDRAPSVPATPARLHLDSVVPSASETGPEGRLICGDNLEVGLALLGELEGRIDLVYLDPPFRTGKNLRVRIGSGEDSRRPEAWTTRPGYSDRWSDAASHLEMLEPRLRIAHRLLSPKGSLYVHLDWRSAPYVRLLLDEIFGPDRLLNEIAWVYHGPSPIRTAFSRKHDTLLVYTKSPAYTFNPDAVRVPYDPSTLRTFAGSSRAGFGKVPDLERGKVPEDWWYFPVVARLHRERTGYPTQKPGALLERILRASSPPGGTVLDLFCGSGTTPVVARRLGRRWIACDSSPVACAVTYRRLLLDDAPGEFAFWQSAAAAPRSLGRSLRLSRHGTEARVRLLHQDRLVWIEVDWEYDGKQFRSLEHAARAWRSEQPLPDLHHRYADARSRRLAVRGADRDGVIYFSERKV
jgi:DNA modification methylase